MAPHKRPTTPYPLRLPTPVYRDAKRWALRREESVNRLIVRAVRRELARLAAGGGED